MEKISEKLIEKKLGEKVKAMGGMSIKLIPLHISGLPDRLVLLPEGRIFFAEIKTTGEKPRPLQVKIIERIKRLGFDVHIIDTLQQLEHILNAK